MITKIKMELTFEHTSYGWVLSAAGYQKTFAGLGKKEMIRLFKDYLREKLGVKKLPFSLYEVDSQKKVSDLKIILESLYAHNKNYTKEQYYNIERALEIVKTINL